MKFSSVTSLHTNTFGCGVAKFGAELAQRLDIPFIGLDSPRGDFPLLSLKWSEFDGWRGDKLFLPKGQRFGIFWHDAGYDTITKAAEVVFYADPSLGSPGLWCPSLITPRQKTVNLFAFGMAGRLQSGQYYRVKSLLDHASIRYHLRVSVGLHEGTSLDAAEKHFDQLKDILGPENVTILGCLSDDAVAEELAKADYVLAFFEKGLRLNNTTVHAALNAGKRVISNCDAQTVEPLRSMVLDINQITAWPKGAGGDYYSWEALIAAMGKECERSRSRIA